MTREAQVDVVILGGGIAGLWTLAHLRQAGYTAVLLEADALGGVQTIAAQGIVHGGAKYSLGGSLSDSARAIGDMPGFWRDCLAGMGALDLRRVRVLSSHQYLWSTEGLGSKVAGFFASKLMQSRMRAVVGSDRPLLFQSAEFKGQVYRLDEPVVDVPGLIAELARTQAEACFAAPSGALTLDPADPGRLALDTPTGRVALRTQRLVLSAGAGNEAILQRLGRDRPVMQRRPLHMLMARGRLPQLYAHCLGASANPRLTITSYPLDNGEMVWNLGGQLAETGVDRNSAEQVAQGRAEFLALLPWLDQTGISWGCQTLDRAEIATPGCKRPEYWHVSSERAVITAWPTKLAFAPRLAADVLSCLTREGVKPAPAQIDALSALSRPPLALPPWARIETWS